MGEILLGTRPEAVIEVLLLTLALAFLTTYLFFERNIKEALI